MERARLLRGALTEIWLAVTAWGLDPHRPAVHPGIARTMTPPESWENPLFKWVNLLVTLVWALSFTIGGVAGIALPPGDRHAPS